MSLLHFVKKKAKISPQKTIHRIAWKIQRDTKSFFWQYHINKGNPPSLNHNDIFVLLGKDYSPRKFRETLCRFLCYADAQYESLKTEVDDFYPEERKTILAHAQQYMEHRFMMLGSEEKRLGERLPWHTDFTVDFTWNPDILYFKIPRIHREKGADIKVPWELSRFQWLMPLAHASRFTGEVKYIDEGKRLILDWIEKNPVAVGVNWTCTMDVGIRAANWITFLSLLPEHSLHDDFMETMTLSLLEHGLFIANNLEYWRSYTNNHYLFDLAGLFFIGLLFRGTKVPQQWLEFSIRELLSEMKKQVYDDGVSFECSTAYHRMVLELYCVFGTLCKKNEITLPEWFWDRLKRMFEFVAAALKPDKTMPIAGDNDSGRFLYFLPGRSDNEHAYLLSLAAILFKDGTFKSSKKPDFESLWFFGDKALETYSQLPRQYSPESRAFPDAGFYIIRHDDNYMFISCGINGQNGVGGHNHNDKLGFELCLGRETIFIDPGQYTYTPDEAWRNRFRSTTAHNTLQVDGMEQNPILPGDIFRLPDRSKATCSGWNITAEGTTFEGSHEGFTINGSSFTHTRRIEHVPGTSTFTIKDSIRNPGVRSFTIKGHFILAPGIRDIHIDNDSKTITMHTPGGQSILVEITSRYTPSIKKENFFYSPGYGMKYDTNKIVFEIAVNDSELDNMHITTNIKKI